MTFASRFLFSWLYIKNYLKWFKKLNKYTGKGWMASKAQPKDKTNKSHTFVTKANANYYDNG